MACTRQNQPVAEPPATRIPGAQVSQRRPPILMLISHFPPAAGGTEAQALQLGQQLVRLGYRVTVLTQSHPGWPASESLCGVQVLRVLLGRGKGIVYALTYLGSLLRHLATQAKARRILHAHHLYLEALAASVWRKGGKIPALAKVAGSGTFGDFARLHRSGVAAALPLLRRLDRIVAVSQEIRQELMAHGFGPERIVDIPNGVDAVRFAPPLDPVIGRSVAGLDVDTVLFLGRLDLEKGLDVALAAWAQVVRRRPGVQLVLAGAGPSEATLKAQAGQLGLGDTVRFLGVSATPEALLKGSDVFLLPSRSEGMSNALLEAMATGLACVATRIGGNLELLRHGENGLLVRPDDAESLAHSLLGLLDDPGLRRRLGAAAREDVLERYALPRVAQRYSELYTRLSEEHA